MPKVKSEVDKKRKYICLASGPLVHRSGKYCSNCGQNIDTSSMTWSQMLDSLAAKQILMLDTEHKMEDNEILDDFGMSVRRALPHIQELNYFVTFDLADAILRNAMHAAHAMRCHIEENGNSVFGIEADPCDEILMLMHTDKLNDVLLAIVKGSKKKIESSSLGEISNEFINAVNQLDKFRRRMLFKELEQRNLGKK